MPETVCTIQVLSLIVLIIITIMWWCASLSSENWSVHTHTQSTHITEDWNKRDNWHKHTLLTNIIIKSRLGYTVLIHLKIQQYPW